MPGLSLKQITDKLNAEFKGDTRRLVFWYDGKAEFIGDINSIELVNAKLYHLEKDNQFYTKYFLERVDTATNYLIYAPFPRPHVRDNHLEDTLLYSKQFFADRASLVMMDLGINPKYKPVVDRHIKFFLAKERTRRFYALEVENYNKETIEVALMSALCKARVAAFDEVVRVVLTKGELEDNRFLEEFQTYDLLDAFWRLCGEQFGYTDVKPTLKKLAITMFVTYVMRFLQGECPPAWKRFISYKPGNITVFLSNLMNHKQYGKKYDALSAFVAEQLQIEKVLETYDPEALVGCDTFEIIDQIIITWLTERLLLEDVGARLHDLSIPEICKDRCKGHFGEQYRFEYRLLQNAFYVVAAAEYQGAQDFADIVKRYIAADYKTDQHYRKFYYNYDQLNDASHFEGLRVLVENIYTNRYLGGSLYNWNKALQISSGFHPLPPQRSFYRRYVEPGKGRIVVIISDALRFEVGQSLFSVLDSDEKCSPKLEAMLGVLPSITRLGMGALLPHKTLELTDDHRALVDGRPSDSTKQREAILNSYAQKSRCVQFDELRFMDRAGLREIFTGMDVIYVYHDQIDARGDKPSTENEVFIACQEAVDEIFAFIKRVSTNASTYHFIVTADHGFIYKRDKLRESDKITYDPDGDAGVNRRFIISEEAVGGDGIRSFPLGRILDNEDTRYLTVPTGSHVFKVAGGGQNFVHGGASPQEMIVPVIDVRLERGRIETKPAQIALVSMVQKITNLILSLGFIQTEPINDVVKKTRYKVFFVSQDNERISNECICIADKRSSNPEKRIFKLRFNFKNKQYDKSKQYYLVVYDEENDIEVLRHSVVMDIAFADDFGFDID